jgi:hypothetical protein
MNKKLLHKLRADLERLRGTIDEALADEPVEDSAPGAPGRPRAARKCRWCGREMSERERRAHQGVCPERPDTAPIPPGAKR